MLFKIAAHLHALLHDEESVGVDSQHLAAEGLDLVLVQAHAQHLQRLAGVAAAAFPAGDAPIQLLHDELRQLPDGSPW